MLERERTSTHAGDRDIDGGRAPGKRTLTEGLPDGLRGRMEQSFESDFDGVTVHEDDRGGSVQFHFAGVVAKAGGDAVTLETFFKKTHVATDNWFDMYGAFTEVEIDEKEGTLSRRKTDLETSLSKSKKETS